MSDECSAGAPGWISVGTPDEMGRFLVAFTEIFPAVKAMNNG